MDQPKAEKMIELLKSEKLPAIVVDLDAFDRNVKALTLFGKPIRLATKSIRVPALIHRAMDSYPGIFKGLMTYSAQETLQLAEQGFDDFLIAYPTVQPSDLSALQKTVELGKQVKLVIDSEEQLSKISAQWKNKRPLSVVIEVDGSLHGWGGMLHLGVRRSPVRSISDVLDLIEKIKSFSGLRFSGLMVYEAQVAGLTDRNPFKKFLNPIAGLVRRISQKRIARLRSEIAYALKSKGIAYEVFNGGGTGNINWASEEAHLTELAAGSALFSPHLFDYYSNIHFEPSCFFALQVVRSSDPGFVTCQGGGYIASGEPSWDRIPKPVWPLGLKLVSTEAAGEVQTPLQMPSGTQLKAGDIVLFRHSKSGEVMERFHEVLVVKGSRITERFPTYRGIGLSTF